MMKQMNCPKCNNRINLLLKFFRNGHEVICPICNTSFKIQKIFRALEGGWGGFYTMVGLILYFIGYPLSILLSVWIVGIVFLRLLDIKFANVMMIDNVPSSALECLRHDMIVKFGVGGYISANDILFHFNPVTAEQFAKVIYATDLMPDIFEDPAEAKNVENIEAVINQNNFESKSQFNNLVEMFKSRFGNQAQFSFE